MIKKIVQSETLADRAYMEIKKVIIRGDFQPGDPLPEENVASLLGISRTPIRKAIAKLAYDGLVTLEKGKIARVAVISEQDFEHYMKLRKVLEVFSAEEAAQLVTNHLIVQLEILMNNQKKALEENDLYTYNVGVYGYDAHRWTERVYKPYSFDTVPRLIQEMTKSWLSL